PHTRTRPSARRSTVQRQPPGTKNSLPRAGRTVETCWLECSRVILGFPENGQPPVHHFTRHLRRRLPEVRRLNVNGPIQEVRASGQQCKRVGRSTRNCCFESVSRHSPSVPGSLLAVALMVPRFQS